MSSRMGDCFARLAGHGEGAFIPFVMLGDPDLETSFALMNALINAGADALELGIPFSDPIADGPVIQAAAQRALAQGVTPQQALALVKRVRQEHPAIPLGLLTYANLVVNRGRDHFYAAAANAGVDTVLVADVPTIEAAPFAKAARQHAIQPVLIAPPDMNAEQIAALTELCEGYTYCIARAGVTGADSEVQLNHDGLFERLRASGAPPPILGFGISQPAHVKAALSAGAAGAISGSAVVMRIAQQLADPQQAIHAAAAFVTNMKAATRQ